MLLFHFLQLNEYKITSFQTKTLYSPCAGHGTHVEVKGKLAGVTLSVYHVGPGNLSLASKLNILIKIFSVHVKTHRSKYFKSALY